MTKVRNDPPTVLAGFKVLALRDYDERVRKDFVNNNTSPLTLPKSNVLYFELEDGLWAVLRPSGTEPKLKIYVGAKADSKAQAEKISAALINELRALVEA